MSLNVNLSTRQKDIHGFVDGESVTKHDSNNFTKGLCRALWVGTGGDVSAVTASGTVLTIKNVPSGYMLVGQFTRVNSTNTTADDMLALY